MRSDGTEHMFGARSLFPLSEITIYFTVNLTYPFEWCQKQDWKRKDSRRSCGQQFNSEDWLSLKSFSERVKQTTWRVRISFDKGPSIDWSTDENLYSRFKMWKQRCELLFTGPMAKIDEEIKCKHLLHWSGEQGIELFNSWDLSADEPKKLDNYWERFEHFVKPHSNELIAAWELHTLSQGTLSWRIYCKTKNSCEGS